MLRRPVQVINELPEDLKADPSLADERLSSQSYYAEVGTIIALSRGYRCARREGPALPRDLIYCLHGGIQGKEGRAIQGYPRMSAMTTSPEYPAAFFVEMNVGHPNYTRMVRPPRAVQNPHKLIVVPGTGYFIGPEDPTHGSRGL